jgi:hypothetical protein
MPGHLPSPDLLSARLAAGPLSSNGHVLGRRRSSTYNRVRLRPAPPSGLVRLGTWPGIGFASDEHWAGGGH